MPKKQKGQLVVTLEIPCHSMEAAVVWANFVDQWFQHVPPVKAGNIAAQYQPDVMFKQATYSAAEWTPKDLV